MIAIGAKQIDPLRLTMELKTGIASARMKEMAPIKRWPVRAHTYRGSKMHTKEDCTPEPRHPVDKGVCLQVSGVAEDAHKHIFGRDLGHARVSMYI